MRKAGDLDRGLDQIARPPRQPSERQTAEPGSRDRRGADSRKHPRHDAPRRAAPRLRVSAGHRLDNLMAAREAEASRCG